LEAEKLSQVWCRGVPYVVSMEGMRLCLSGQQGGQVAICQNWPARGVVTALCLLRIPVQCVRRIPRIVTHSASDQAQNFCNFTVRARI
jgi:hypothetical protein